MNPMNSGAILANFQAARKAAGPLRKKSAILKRFSTFTQPTSPAMQPQRVDTSRTITGIFHYVTPKDILNSGGYYVAGDVISHTDVEIQHASNTAGAVTQPDRLVFEGFTYQVQGKTKRPIVAGGRAYTWALWRKA